MTYSGYLVDNGQIKTQLQRRLHVKQVAKQLGHDNGFVSADASLASGFVGEAYDPLRAMLASGLNNQVYRIYL
jgi:Zn-dependent membrane protease YugP